MDTLRKFKIVNLSAIIIEHIHKEMYFKDKKHGLEYSYLLNKVFDHFKVECSKGLVGSVKKTFVYDYFD